MQKTIFFLILFLPLFGTAQETKQIVNKKNNEVYSVLKTDKSKKHGIYKKLNFDGSPRITGNYQNGLKDGIWEFYNYKGELQQKFDFTNMSLVYNKPNEKTKDTKYKIYSGKDTLEAVLQIHPIYIGSDAMMYESVFKDFNYPKEAMESGTYGKVFIAFDINQKGEVSNYKVKSGIGHGCDEEALRVVKNIPSNWLPGVLNDKVVNVEYVLPISFQLTER